MEELDNAYDADINSDDDTKYCINNKYCKKCKKNKQNKQNKQSKIMKRINKKTNKKIYKLHDILNKLKL